VGGCGARHPGSLLPQNELQKEEKSHNLERGEYESCLEASVF